MLPQRVSQQIPPNPNEMGDNLPNADVGAVQAIGVGNRKSCALLTNGSGKRWGLNYTGYLGLGDTNDRADEPGSKSR